MELFRNAFILETDPSESDWTREHGFTQESSFPFPDLYLSDAVAGMLKEDAELTDFLNGCLRDFVNHKYGHMSSLDLADNFIQREFAHKTTWLRGIYPSDGRPEIHLDLLYDMGLIHIDDVPPRDLIRSQKLKESEQSE